MPDLAIYGLGEMGSDIARCLVGRGLSVVGFDPVCDPEIESPNFQRGDSVGAVASIARAHLIVVKRLADLESLLLADDGLSARAPGSSLIMLHTTVTPQVARELSSRVRRTHGHTLLDAALSRRGGQIIEGSLSLFVGGSDTDFTVARRVMDMYADNVVHVGPTGAGMTVKLCNNWLLYGNRHTALQALKVGQELGVDVDVLRAALTTSTGSSWALEHYSTLDEEILAGRGAPLAMRDRTASELHMAKEMIAAVGELPSTLQETFALLDLLEQPPASDVDHLR
ncbi:NAD(P)-dependent oxidoreductase [Nocardia gipuzkoensis]